MKIIKLENGRVQLVTSSGEVYQSLDPSNVNAKLNCFNNSNIQLFANGQYINITVEDVEAYQIEPNPEVTGPFAPAELLDILDNYFFLT